MQIMKKTVDKIISYSQGIVPTPIRAMKLFKFTDELGRVHFTLTINPNNTVCDKAFRLDDIAGIANFLCLAKKGSWIHNSEEVNNMFCMISTVIPNVNNPSATKKDILQLIQFLKSELDKATRKAQSDQKKLLIHIEETYSDKRSLLVSLILMILSSEQGLRNIITGTHEGFVTKEIADPVDVVASSNIKFILLAAREMDLRFYHGDKKKNAEFFERTQSMIDSIIGVNEDLILISMINSFNPVYHSERITHNYYIHTIDAAFGASGFPDIAYPNKHPVRVQFSRNIFDSKLGSVINCLKGAIKEMKLKISKKTASCFSSFADLIPKLPSPTTDIFEAQIAQRVYNAMLNNTLPTLQYSNYIGSEEFSPVNIKDSISSYLSGARCIRPVKEGSSSGSRSANMP